MSDALQAVNLYAPGDIRLEPMLKPEIEPGDILIRVKACGICASDHSFNRMGSFYGAEVGMALGHEFSGVVAEVGAEVNDIHVGDAIIVQPMACDNLIGCGGGQGAFADVIQLKNAQKNVNVFALPKALSFAEGALVEPIAVGTHAVNVAAPSKTSKVVVLGAGPIGLGAVMALVARGVENIAVVDLSEQRLALAKQIGAHHIYNAQSAKTGRFLRGIHGVAQGVTVGSDIYIDAVGIEPVLQEVIKIAKEEAVITVVALHQKHCAIDFSQVVAKQLVIKGSIGYPDEFAQVINMLENIDFDNSELITHYYPLSEFTQAMQISKDSQQAVKVMVTMNDNW